VYDLEPQKVTGIVRYVGRVDSEFVDNRVYVGVKLDEPCKCLIYHPRSHDLCLTHNVDGNTDGVLKGKRYFKCPANHGRFVRISNIISVLPVKVSVTSNKGRFATLLLPSPSEYVLSSISGSNTTEEHV